MVCGGFATLQLRHSSSFFSSLHSIYYPRSTSIRSRSLPVATQIRGHIASPPPPSLPTKVRAFIFIARRIQHRLPLSTRVELYLPTLLGALSC